MSNISVHRSAADSGRRPAAGNRRIQELDLLRGLSLLLVIGDHIHYDLTVLLGWSVPLPGGIAWLFDHVGILFILLSGICVQLTRRNSRRGWIVLGCGLVISLFTLTADRITGGTDMGIRFGILHLLGICMLLAPWFQRYPSAVLLLGGVLCIGLGPLVQAQVCPSPLLFPLGLRTAAFRSADYWPLLPHLGWFLLGIVLGRLLYPTRTPRLPALQGRLRPLAFCGRHSLAIYLIHQPLLMLLFTGFPQLL